MRIISNPLYIDCPRLDVCGDHCPLCDGSGTVSLELSRVATLTHNLAVAAFGAAMFRAGDNFGFHMGEDHGQCTCQWSPGRGVPYAGSTRCEHDDEPELGCCPRNTWGDEFHDPGCGDDDARDPVPGPNGCTCGFNGDCNCRFVP